MKFSQKVVAASSALMLATVALLSYQQTQTVNKEVERLVHSSLHEMVKGVQNSVVAAVEGKKSLALSTTQIIEQAANNREYVASVLERPELKDRFVVIGLGYDRDGHFIENLDNWQAGSDFDPRQRPWYLDAKRAKKLVFTEPYVDEASKEIIVSIATPVQQQGEYVGSMTYDVNLSVLTQLVNGINLLDAGYLFITTADGRIIAHPDSRMNGQMLNRSLPSLNLQDGMQEFEQNGDHHLAYFSHIPEENWYVGAIIDEDKAFSALDKMAQSTLISLLIGGLISVLALGMLLRHLLKPLGVLNRAIDDVATGEGDLTKRLSTDTDEEFAQLAKGFNHFASTLQQRIIDTKALGIAILNESEQSAAGSMRALQAMSSQLQELEQLATAMHEMAMTATDVAGNAQGAAKAAQDVEDATREGSRIVNDTAQSIHSLSMRIEQAVEEVQGLETATNNIETILQVINEIADQTNLLALNAAIEAARAGESGRGFAVVADEVRTLAQRTQQSTTEIRTMIEQLQAGAGSVSNAMRDSQITVEETVAKAQAANVSLDRIQVAIQQISDMNMQIASAAEQQSLVAEEINGNTIKIKDLATQVAHAAQEDNRLMESQTKHVRQQDEILNQFIV